MMHELSKVEIISILINDDIREGGDIGNLILKSIKEKKESLKENDVIVITHKIISKSEGRTIDLTKIIPSEESKKISSNTGKDPRLVELIIDRKSVV